MKLTIRSLQHQQERFDRRNTVRHVIVIVDYLQKVLFDIGLKHFVKILSFKTIFFRTLFQSTSKIRASGCASIEKKKSEVVNS